MNYKKNIFLIIIFLACPVFANAQNPPNLIYPTSADSPVYAGEINFQWSNTEANYYKYHVNLSTGEAEEGVIQSLSKKIYSLNPGDYSWAACSCNDAEGEDCVCANLESFIVESAPAGFSGGLVPCGRRYDDPTTENINESEPCGLKHIFLLFKNILDFLLWRLGLVVLPILVLVVGAMFYFSLGTAETLARVKSLLKSALTGYILIFLAWIIVTVILGLLGYQFEIFGRWWIIKF